MFDRAFYFVEGLSLIRIGSFKTGKYGYIDTKGGIAVNPQYYGGHHFSEGLACVKETKEGKWGYIDKTGKVIIGFQFDIPADFEHGLAKVRIGTYKSGVSGFIDKTGKFIWQSS